MVTVTGNAIDEREYFSMMKSLSYKKSGLFLRKGNLVPTRVYMAVFVPDLYQHVLDEIVVK